MTRLEAVESLLEKTDTLADIGCDHGFVSEYALKNGLAAKVIAADISLPSLKKAERRLKGFSNAEFKHTDGLNGISGAGCVVIAGLGGYNMIEILSPAAIIRQRPDCSLILQPQNHVREVREYIIKIGYKPAADFPVCERGKYYDIIKAAPGTTAINAMQAEFGFFYLDNGPVRLERIKRLIIKYKSFKATEKNTAMLDMLGEVLCGYGQRLPENN